MAVISVFFIGGPEDGQIKNVGDKLSTYTSLFQRPDGKKTFLYQRVDIGFSTGVRTFFIPTDIGMPPDEYIMHSLTNGYANSIQAEKRKKYHST